MRCSCPVIVPRRCWPSLIGAAAASCRAVGPGGPRPPHAIGRDRLRPDLRAEPASIEADVEFTLFLAGRGSAPSRSASRAADPRGSFRRPAQFGAPLNVTVNRFELKYTSDWQPNELHIEATQPGRHVRARDVVRRDHGDQRHHPERHHDVQDRPDVGPHDRAAQQFLRRVRGARARGSRRRSRAPTCPPMSHRQRRSKINVKAVADEQLRHCVGPARDEGRTSSPSRIPADRSPRPSRSIRADGCVRFEIPSAGLRLDPFGPRGRRHAVAADPEPHRHGRHHPGARLQPGGHADDAGGRRHGCGTLRSCWSRARVSRARRGRRRDPDLRAARGLAGASRDSSFSATTSAASARAAAAASASRCRIMRTTWRCGEVARRAAGRRSAAHRRRRTQRRRSGRDAGGGARGEDFARSFSIAAPGTPGSRTDPRAAASRPRCDEDARSRAPGEDRAPEEDPGGGDRRQGMGRDSAGAARAGGLHLVPQPAAVRPGEGDAEGRSNRF